MTSGATVARVDDAVRVPIIEVVGQLDRIRRDVVNHETIDLDEAEAAILLGDVELVRGWLRDLLAATP